jgi:hypothetical protein
MQKYKTFAHNTLPSFNPYTGGGEDLGNSRRGQVFSLGNSRQGGCHLPDGSEIPREGVKIMDFQEAVFKNCLEIPRDTHEKLCFWKFQILNFLNSKVLAPRVRIKNAMCHLKIRCHEFEIS